MRSTLKTRCLWLKSDWLLCRGASGKASYLAMEKSSSTICQKVSNIAAVFRFLREKSGLSARLSPFADSHALKDGLDGVITRLACGKDLKTIF